MSAAQHDPVASLAQRIRTGAPPLETNSTPHDNGFFSRLLSTEQVAELLHVSTGAVHRFASERRLAFYKLGKRSWFLLEDVQRFVETRRRPAAE